MLTLLSELNDAMRPRTGGGGATRARLGEIFTEIVRSCTSRTDGHADNMLQCLIDARYRDGRGTTETEVVGMLVSTLFAGQHNSSNASTWTGARLLTTSPTPSTCAPPPIVARREARVDYDALRGMHTLHHYVKEALRLNPPALMLLRHARRGFSGRTRDSREYEVTEGRAVASPLVCLSGISAGDEVRGSATAATPSTGAASTAGSGSGVAASGGAVCSAAARLPPISSSGRAVAVVGVSPCATAACSGRPLLPQE